MMEKYGPPNVAGPILLAWLHNEPWKRTIVFRFAAIDDPTAQGDVLAQTIIYPIPASKWDDLSSFGHGLTYDPLSQELTARASSEEANFLALNLADEIVSGRRDVPAANRFYQKTISQSLSGKSSRYMERLLFDIIHARKRPSDALRLDRF
jgi:hypothetical protein